MKVKFTDLNIVTSCVKKEFIKEAREFLDRGNFILTGEVKKFENQWAKKLKSNFAVGVSSGADALYLSLTVLGIGEGDEVIIQGNAYNASVVSILRVKAVPVFADIDPNTLNIDPGKITKLITRKTKAIMPVHLYGQSGNMEKIREIAKKHKLYVVEDCAQAHLAKYNNKFLGTFGDMGAFSFYPTKNLGAFGDAGAIVSKDGKYLDKLFALRNLGQTKKNVHTYFGYNMRLDPIQAVALSLKLKFLDKNTKLRQKIAKNYEELFYKYGIENLLVKKEPHSEHVYHLFVIKLASRQRVQSELFKKGIETAVHYPFPVYKQPFYKLKYNKCPITDLVCKQVLSLPMHLGLTLKEQEYVVKTLSEIIK